MRLNLSRMAAEENLTARLCEGYQLREELQREYATQSKGPDFDIATYMQWARGKSDEWVNATNQDLMRTFPTPLESASFADRWSWSSVDYMGIDQRFGRLINDTLPTYIERLREVLEGRLPNYTDLPQSDRLFIEDIDSFRCVRDVNPGQVASKLESGRIELAEDDIQLGLEQILDVSLHKKDWGGEANDLYAGNVIVNGARRSAAFLLKGKGLTISEMRIRDCGANGDQIVRLFKSPAQLFVVQYVGPISEAVIDDVESKTRDLRGQGKDARCLIMDGQDTARLLHAYGKL